MLRQTPDAEPRQCEAAKRPVDTMPKDDDGVMDNLDSRVERVEGFSRKERKGRKELNHGIHRIHGKVLAV